MHDEARLAGLLARTLEDETLWEWLDAPAGPAHEALAERAVKLFRHIWPLTEARLDASPVHHALAVMRDIAGLAAVQSYPWTDQERAEFQVRVPGNSRALTELSIRLYDIDAWAERNGHPLTLRSSADVPEEAWPDPPIEVDDAERRAARDVCATLDLYEAVLATRDDPRMQEHLTGAEGRRGFCALPLVARRMLIYGRGHFPHEGAEIALGAHVLAADALFVATRDPGGELFPTEEYLRWLLDPEGREWLLDNGCELPESLE